MTACAIENNAAGAAGTAATTEPAPGPVEAAGPAESQRPRAAGTADEGADPLRVGASGAGPGDGGVPGPAAVSVGSAASAGPIRSAGSTAPGGSVGQGVRDASAEAPVPPLPSSPPVPAFPSGALGGGAEACEAPARVVPTMLTIAADHSYAARLTAADTEAAEPAWFPERWTLGPEPYAVPLPLGQPEEADSDVLPLSDGRVLIRRRVADRHTFSLLYPTGPATGEVPLGALECEDLTLLPPPPDGMSAYALVPGDRSTGVWLVAGGPFGPEHVADVAGHCSGGAWLDREGRLLALDRQLPDGGPVKAVAVDLERGGEVTPLLQIAPDSDDRLLLADADSGLLLIRSDAPGNERLGWGVLGSCLPVRFPECLHPADVAVTPIAVQPGQMLMPENCAVALRLDGPGGSWVGLWRPAGRRMHHVAAPEGWLAGAGFWSREGTLHLPYAQPGAPCGVAVTQAPVEEPHQLDTTGAQPSAAPAPPGVCKPVPLGQAPLTGSTAAG